jgi:hypothetical protein
LNHAYCQPIAIVFKLPPGARGDSFAQAIFSDCRCVSGSEYVMPTREFLCPSSFVTFRSGRDESNTTSPD